MFRRLRLRLMLINLVIIAALFILLTSGTYLFSSIEIQNRSMMLVQRISSEVISGLISDFPPRDVLPPRRDIPPPKELLPPSDSPSVPPVFFIKVAPFGAITFTSTSSPLTLSELTLLANKTLPIPETTGTVNFEQSSYYYSRSELPSGEHLLVFHDLEQQKYMLQIFLMALGIIGVVCLILSFFGSLFMANRAMVPIERAWQQQKNFVADASHELRTPLAVIQTNLEIVRSNQDETVEHQNRWLSNIQEELLHITKLVDSLLLLARADSQQLLVENTYFPLHTAIRQAVTPFQPIAQSKGVEIFMFLYPTNYYGDEAKIKQIVCILLDNALRYTSSGSITVQLHQVQRTAKLDVIDTGCGISPEHLEKVFDRFYQADPSRAKKEGGAGLGLAIAKCLVECQRGRIEARSIPGEGTTFSIYLPLENKNSPLPLNQSAPDTLPQP